MRRVLTLALLAMSVALASVPVSTTFVLAEDEDKGDPPPTTTSVPDPSVGASVTSLVAGSPGGGTNGTDTTVPSCFYRDSVSSQGAVDLSNELLRQYAIAQIPTVVPGETVTVSIVSFVYNGALHKYDVAAGAFQKRQYRVCPPGAPVTGVPGRWVTVTVTPDPVAELSDEVLSATSSKALVPLPSAVNPPTRVAANLGLWLAVDPGRRTATVRAELGPTVWMQTTATLVSTRWDMGNGDEVTCAGGGTPIPDSARNEVEQSPTCGYTYTSVEDLGPLTISVTGLYEVSWMASNGVTGTFPSITTNPNVIPYEMYEIQTVGGVAGG
jgi:hypothetical protein